MDGDETDDPHSPEPRGTSRSWCEITMPLRLCQGTHRAVFVCPIGWAGPPCTRSVAILHLWAMPAFNFPLASDLAPGDAKSVGLDLGQFTFHRIRTIDDPLFETAYRLLWVEFGEKGEMERRET